MSNFDEWFRVRHNIPISFDIVDDVLSEWPWNKTPTADKLESDPQFQSRVARFAAFLGLGAIAPSDASLMSSLANIVACRIYGKKYGGIQLSDLSHVWQALQEPITKPTRRMPNPPTIAQKHGITRPLAIPTKVPGAQTTTQYAVTQSALDFDKQAVQELKSGGGGGAVAPGRGVPPKGGAPGTAPFGGVGGGGSPAPSASKDLVPDMSPKAKKLAVAQLYPLIQPLEAKLNAGGKLTPKEKSQLNVLRRLYASLEGSTPPPLI